MTSETQCVVCGVSDKESMDKCCCPCFASLMIPIGGGVYHKLSPDLCVPMQLHPQEDGTLDGTMQGIYQKKPEKTVQVAAGAPPSSEEMTR